MHIFKHGDKVFYGGEECIVLCHVNGYGKDTPKIVAIEGKYLTANVSEKYLLELNPQYKERIK